jgi:copper chaperone
MMITKSIIQVEKIKCGGCGNSISTKLLSQKGVNDVKVDIESGTIKLSHEQSLELASIEQLLNKMGYPVVGENNLGAKAKSYVSCMIGRMSD